MKSQYYNQQILILTLQSVYLRLYSRFSTNMRADKSLARPGRKQATFPAF